MIGRKPLKFSCEISMHNLLYGLIISSLCAPVSAYMLIGRQTSKLEALFHYEISLVSSELVVDYRYHQGMSQSAWILPKTAYSTSILSDHIHHSILYASEVIVQGKSPSELLERISIAKLSDDSDTWQMNYFVINPYIHENKPKISSKMLLCAISQRMKGTPALYADEQVDHTFDVVELNNGLCIGKRISEATGYNILSQLWSKRPFAFSSASSLDLTESIMNTFLHLRIRKGIKGNGLLLDPFCGSGTMAISALRYA
jgi:hypothetical protein